MSEEIKEQIIKNLRQVYDPEIRINVYDLGLIYEVDTTELPKVKITHTLTSVFCPAADQIVEDIKYATESVEGVDIAEIITTFDPPFSPEMMPEDTRLALGI